MIEKIITKLKAEGMTAKEFDIESAKELTCGCVLARAIHKEIDNNFYLIYKGLSNE